MQVLNQSFGENWCLYCGDSAEVLRELPALAIDFSVYSPPFSHLYVYSATDRDLGNCANDAQFFEHYAFIIKELFRVTKPGRLSAVHVAQIPLQKAHDGEIGLKDFRGDVIRAHQSHGWIYAGEAVVQKNPQSQAVRTKSKALLFVQLHKDSSWSRPALADYVLLFRKPGENAVRIKPDITNNQWIEWANPIWQVETTDEDKALGWEDVRDLAPGSPMLWYGIRESDTLNAAEARSPDDTRHIAPLQLETIRRCVRLWSNPGETVLSPFAGLASEGVMSIRLNRRFIGCELKPEYWECGVRNLRNAERASTQPTLFSLLDEEEEVPA